MNAHSAQVLTTLYSFLIRKGEIFFKKKTVQIMHLIDYISNRLI